MEFLWPMAFGAVALAGMAVVPRLQARRRRAALRSGSEAAFRVRLAGAAAPYPQTPRRGVLRVSDDRLTWTARGRGPVLDLTASGLRPTGLRDPRIGEGGGQNEAVLTAADAVGTAVRLVGLGGTVQNLHEVLSERAAPQQPGPPVTLEPNRTGHAGLLLPAALLLLAVVGGAFTTWAVTAGVRVSGTVVSEEDADAYCKVRWTDPRAGSEQINSLDCYWDIGDEVPLVALADPLRGEVVDADDPWFWGVLSASAAVVALGWGAWQLRSRRRELTAPATAAVPVAQPPALDETRLDYPTVVATMRARAAAEGWRFDADGAEPVGSNWLLASPRRALASAVALSLAPLLLAAFFAVLTGWTSLAGLWSSTGETATATATVTEEPYEAIVPFGPEEIEVRFPVRDSGTETTLVAVRGLPDRLPETVEVEYSRADPDRARATEYDGAARGAALAGAILLVGVALTGWRLWQTVAGWLAERQALRHGKHVLRYVLVPATDGTCLLLLYPDGLAPRPAFAVELADDLLGRLDGAGVVDVHGRLEASHVVVPRVANRDLATASPLLDLEAADVVHLVNGTEPAVA